MSFKVISHKNGVGFECDAASEKDMFRLAAFFHSIPDDCPICRSPVIFQYRNPGEDEFWGLICKGSPKHEINFSFRRKTEYPYLDDSKWKIAYGEPGFGKDIHSSNPPNNQPPAQNGNSAQTEQDFKNRPGTPNAAWIAKAKEHISAIKRLNGTFLDIVREEKLGTLSQLELETAGKKLAARRSDLERKNQQQQQRR
jgi:hypothetical protein